MRNNDKKQISWTPIGNRFVARGPGCLKMQFRRESFAETVQLGVFDGEDEKRKPVWFIVVATNSS